MTEKRTFSDKFALRMPDGLRERIKAASTKRGISMNGLIVEVLEREFPALDFDMMDLHAFVRAYEEALTPSEREVHLRAMQALLRESGSDLVVMTDDEGDILITRSGHPPPPRY